MKKILSAIMSVTMTLASLSISGASAKGNNTAKTIDTIAFVSTIRGDINCDGKTNKLDHDIVRAYNKAISAGEEYTLNEQGMKNADLNSDGIINETDADMINDILQSIKFQKAKQSAAAAVSTTSKAVTTTSASSSKTTAAVTTAASSAPTAASTATVSFILPERNEKTTVSNIWKSSQPVWDENGIYRGTNALTDLYLETQEVKAIDFPITDTVDLSDLKVNLIVKHCFDIDAYDVTGMLNVQDYGYSDKDTFYVVIGTDYEYYDGGYKRDIQTVKLEFKVSGNKAEPVTSSDVTESSTTTTSKTTSSSSTTTTSKTTSSSSSTKSSTVITNDPNTTMPFILPKRNENVTSVCVSDSDQPVWDEDGHYRGTNALLDAYLEVRSVSVINVPSEVKADLSKIKVVLVEKRRFNIYEHDVSGMLYVDTWGCDDDILDVTIRTDYSLSEKPRIKPLRLEFKVSAGKAIPITTSKTTSSSTTTSKTTSTTASTSPSTSSSTTTSKNTGTTGTTMPVKSAVIKIKTPPAKSTYYIGEKLDLSGGIAYASGRNGDMLWDTFDQPIDSQYFKVDASNFDNTKVGTYTIYVYPTGYPETKAKLVVKVIEGTTASTTSTTVTSSSTSSITTSKSTATSKNTEIKYGDANCDGNIDLADAVLIMQSISNPSKYGIEGNDKNRITSKGQKNADCSNTGDGVTNADALAIQKYKLSLISELPEKK